MPPVDQMALLPKNPAWLACLGVGRLGGDAAHVPAGHAATDSESTSADESKYPPPVVSPPSAYRLVVVGLYASPKSARCGVHAGPLLHVPVAMSSLMLVLLFAAGALGALPRALCSTELAGCPLTSFWPGEVP